MDTVNDAMSFPFHIESNDQLLPAEEYAVLRAERPVQRVVMSHGAEAWLVSRYADVKFVLSDPRFSSAEVLNAEIMTALGQDLDPTTLPALDNPGHSRLRRLVASAFTAKSIQWWQPHVERMVTEFIAVMRKDGPPADLVEHVTAPLPMATICELLGVPATDRHVFQRFTEAIFGTDDNERQKAMMEFGEYLPEHVALHRHGSGNDLISRMGAARDEQGNRLTDQEIITLVGTMLLAGHESTSSALPNYIYFLLTTGRWSHLLEHPGQLDAAVEELIRYVTFFDNSPPRVATEDVEISGQLIRKGEAVFVSLVSANFDDSVFERAEDFDMRRGQNRHMTFGFGAHRCLGARLATMEFRVAIGVLLREFPGLRLAVGPGDVPWRSGSLLRNPKELLVCW